MIFYFFLVGGFKHEFHFPFHIWDVILPTDELIFFKMVIAPPTSFICPGFKGLFGCWLGFPMVSLKSNSSLRYQWRPERHREDGGDFHGIW